MSQNHNNGRLQTDGNLLISIQKKYIFSAYIFLAFLEVLGYINSLFKGIKIQYLV